MVPMALMARLSKVAPYRALTARLQATAAGAAVLAGETAAAVGSAVEIRGDCFLDRRQHQLQHRQGRLVQGEEVKTGSEEEVPPGHFSSKL